MKNNLVEFICGLMLLAFGTYVIYLIISNTPQYKCVDGAMYENYMRNDVWIKTKVECLDIK